MKYPEAPKYWDGFNSLGKKMTQGLAMTDSPFLAVRGADGTVAYKRNFMNEVVGADHPEYWTRGVVVKEGVEEVRSVAAVDVSRGFYKDNTVVLDYIGDRRGVGWRSGADSETSFSTEYDTLNPNRFKSRTVNSTADMRVLFGSIYSKQSDGFDIPFSVSYPTTAPRPFNVLVLPAAPRSHPLRVTDDGVDMFTVTPLTGFATDLFGAPMTSAVYYRYNTGGGPANGFFFPSALLPAAARRNINRPVSVTVGPNKLYALVLADWTYPEVGEALFPSARLLYSEDGGGTWGVQDVTGQVLDDIPWLPAAAADQRDPALYDGAWWGSMQMIWYTSKMVAIGNDEALLTFVFRRRSPALPLTTDFRLVSRTYRLSGGGMTLLDQQLGGEFVAFPPPPPERPNGPDFYITQDMVYLGQDTVLAKRVYGFPGSGIDVSWVVSENRGVTWAPVAALGLPTPLSNQFFGNMTVRVPRSDRRPGGEVFMPVYESAESGYYVYSTRDLGATWRRRSRIASTEAFRRVDTMISGDGGGNFNDLQYIGTQAKPAPYNPSLPDLLRAP